MKKFKKIFLFIIVLLLICVGLDELYGFLIRQNMNLKSSYILKEKVNADILIMGSCEPLWMISPAIINKHTSLITYNLSLSHSDFGDVFLNLYLYLKNNQAPKYVFLFVTPESMDEDYNIFHPYFFAPFIEDTLIKNVVKEFDPDYYKWSRIPFMKYAYYNNKVNFSAFQGLKHYIQGNKTPYYADGYEPPFQLNWDHHFKTILNKFPDGWKYSWSSRRENYLKKVIDLALAHSIKIYLFESPLLKEAEPYQLNRAECIEKIKNIALHYKTQYLLFDTMQIANSKKYFMSPLVTNLEGSEIFTNTFGRYIRENIIKPNTK